MITGEYSGFLPHRMLPIKERLDDAGEGALSAEKNFCFLKCFVTQLIFCLHFFSL